MPPRPSRRWSSYRPLKMTWLCCDMRSPGYEMGVCAPEPGDLTSSTRARVPVLLRPVGRSQSLPHHGGGDRCRHLSTSLLARAFLPLHDDRHGHAGHLAGRSGEADDPRVRLRRVGAELGRARLATDLELFEHLVEPAG